MSPWTSKPLTLTLFLLPLPLPIPDVLLLHYQADDVGKEEERGGAHILANSAAWPGPTPSGVERR